MAGKFEPKTPMVLNAPKDDLITLKALSIANGEASLSPWKHKLMNHTGENSELCYVAIKGRVYDVTGNKAYLPGGPYHVFAGHDASRALALSSTKAEDVRPEWEDLGEKEKKTLDEWITFFSKRYNVVGILTAED